jgi:hypothetical protein
VTVTRFHIAGMDCAAEEQLVRMALFDVEGVVRVEFLNDRREVVIDHHAAPGAIEDALRSLDLGARHLDDISEIGPAVDAVLDSAVPDLVAGAVIFAVVANGARRILGLSR